MERFEVDNVLGQARDGLDKAFDGLADAADKAAGHPVEDRIISILNDVESLQKEIEKIRDRLMEEVKSA